jgi:hypothetical protein
MKRMLSGLMPPIAALACLAAWAALREAMPHCIYCYSADIWHAPSREQSRRHECRACGRDFVRVDDVPFGFSDVLDSLGHPRDLYGK